MLPAGARVRLESIGLGLAVVVPAFLVVATSQRLLLRVMLAWLMAPVLVYAGVIAWEALTRPTTKDPLGTAFYGFMIISPVLAPPWLAACMAGFGLGFGVRWLVRLVRPPSAHPRAALTQPVAALPAAAAIRPAVIATALPQAASTEETPGWRHVHIGFDHDALRIGGLDVWQQTWRPAGGHPVRLPHPTHPTQMHVYEIFAIGDGQRPVFFAAAELSNGVWGFAIRKDDPAEAQGISQDGSLRYEHQLGPFNGARYDSVSPAAVLTDAANGAVLVDCSAWSSSRITPNADGTMFLRLQ